MVTIASKRFEHPALDEMYGALDAIKEAEVRLKAAKQKLQEEVLALPAKIGDNDDLRDEIFHHLYWFHGEISTTRLREVFHYKHPAQVKQDSSERLIEDAYLEMTCARCKQPYQIRIASRDELKRKLISIGRRSEWENACNTCLSQDNERLRQKYEQYQMARATRLEELRTMPYREYLTTPEWQERRKKALKRAGFRCQVCNAYGVRLNTHHRTYARRGNEDDRDLVVLCENCHGIFHANGSLAEEDEK